MSQGVVNLSFLPHLRRIDEIFQGETLEEIRSHECAYHLRNAVQPLHDMIREMASTDPDIQGLKHLRDFFSDYLRDLIKNRQDMDSYNTSNAKSAFANTNVPKLFPVEEVMLDTLTHIEFHIDMCTVIATAQESTNFDDLIAKLSEIAEVHPAQRNEGMGQGPSPTQ